MKLIGNVSWYIEEKPQRFDPLTAKEGDVFYQNGSPLHKFRFGGYDETSGIICYCDLKTNKDYECDIRNFNQNALKDNPENLNLKTSIGLDVHPDMPIIAIPEVLQEFIPLRSVAAVRWTEYNNGWVKKVIFITLIVGDTGPSKRFIKGWKEENGVVTVDGRIGDLPSGIFKQFADLDVGILKNVEIELL